MDTLLPQLFSLTGTLTQCVNFLHQLLTSSNPGDRFISLVRERKCFYRPNGSLCWHHFVFRQRAHRCSQPHCSWRRIPSATPRAPDAYDNGLCFYHQRFGHYARKCRDGCPRFAVRSRQTTSLELQTVTSPEELVCSAVIQTDDSIEVPTTSTLSPVRTQTPRIHWVTRTSQTEPNGRTIDSASQTDGILDRREGVVVKSNCTQTDVVAKTVLCGRMTETERLAPGQCQVCRLINPNKTWIWHDRQGFCDWLQLNHWQRKRFYTDVGKLPAILKA